VLALERAGLCGFGGGGVFSTKGFCPNFITKATKLQGSNNKAKKKKQHRKFSKA
jgi:hypothetical protein